MIGSASITLASSGGRDVTTITGRIRFPDDADNSSTIDGFTITKGAYSGPGLDSDGNSPTILNCTVENFTGSYSGGAVDLRNGSCVLRHCEFHNNRWGSGGGLFLLTMTGVVVDSCLFQGNSATRRGAAAEIRYTADAVFSNNVIVDNAVGTRGGVLVVEGCSGFSIHNNTIVGNRLMYDLESNHTTGITFEDGSDIETFNNIVAYNEGAFVICVLTEVTGLRLEYNNVYGNGFWPYWNVEPGTGSISVVPGFQSLPDSNFELRSSSACLDAGDPSTVYNDPDGTRGDMGALRVDQAADTDSDGIPDGIDNCRFTANSDQTDADSDGDGDACDACPDDPLNDADFDGICDGVDVCPLDSLDDLRW